MKEVRGALDILPREKVLGLVLNRQAEGPGACYYRDGYGKLPG